MNFEVARDMDTICALATPHGVGGISVVRVSGQNAMQATRQIAPFLPKTLESHRAYFGVLKKTPKDKRTGKVLSEDFIDEGLITVFLGKKSYTGEPLAEISCHGNPLIVKEIIDFLRQNGVRLAKPGEFTYRAFMNGKIDLLQAESVLSLIQAQSERSKNQSLKQLRGYLSRKLSNVADDLTKVLSIIEASIDFTTEDIDVLPHKDMLDILEKRLIELEELLSTYKSGKILKEGYQVAIIGRPNVGKSSLLNTLVRKDRAIVSSLAGTTRDVVEGDMILNGCCIKLFDTAGLRQARGSIEKIGVERAKQVILEADLLIFVTDVKKDLSKKAYQEDLRILQDLPSVPVVKVKNKKDLLKTNEKAALSKEENQVSTLTGEGIEDLKTCLSQELQGEFKESPLMILQERQFETLEQAKVGFVGGIRLLKASESLELVALELQIALKALFEVLGRQFNDDVMDRVFKDFCIGK